MSKTDVSKFIRCFLEKIYLISPRTESPVRVAMTSLYASASEIHARQLIVLAEIERIERQLETKGRDNGHEGDSTSSSA